MTGLVIAWDASSTVIDPKGMSYGEGLGSRGFMVPGRPPPPHPAPARERGQMPQPVSAPGSLAARRQGRNRSDDSARASPLVFMERRRGGEVTSGPPSHHRRNGFGRAVGFCSGVAARNLVRHMRHEAARATAARTTIRQCSHARDFRGRPSGRLNAWSDQLATAASACRGSHSISGLLGGTG